jgi:hypothetical protein
MDYPIPVVTRTRNSHWAPRPIEFLYGLEGVRFKSYQPPIQPFDAKWVMTALKRLPDLAVAEALVRAARRYALAMELIEEQPEICYQLFISAVETMAQEVELGWKPEAQDKLELHSSQALLKSAARIGLSEEVAKQLALEACKDHSWSGRKFKEFILENIAAEGLAKKDDLFIVPEFSSPHPEDFAEALTRIYRIRGGATHRGHDFPPSARIGPSHMIPSAAVGDIMNHKPFPPVGWFERVVQNAICGYVRKQLGAPADQGGDA